jgi:hypothetical protein
VSIPANEMSEVSTDRLCEIHGYLSVAHRAMYDAWLIMQESSRNQMGIHQLYYKVTDEIDSAASKIYAEICKRHPL